MSPTPRPAALDVDKADKMPPRERILAAARELFYRHGIRAVGVDAVAETAGTNKMTLYRHFASKDELVAECLRRFAAEAADLWAELERTYPQPLRRLHGWLAAVAERVTDPEDRGCALANAAIELPEHEHPARRVIETFKAEQRDRLSKLCREAGVGEPDMLADELFVLLEGARVCRQCLGTGGPAARLVRMGEALIATHLPAH